MNNICIDNFKVPANGPAPPVLAVTYHDTHQARHSIISCTSGKFGITDPAKIEYRYRQVVNERK